MPISELLKWKTIGATLNGSNASVRRCIEYGVERFFFDFFFFSVKKKARHFSNVKDYRKIDQIHHRNVLNNTFESANFFWENMPLKPNNNGFEYILNEFFFIIIICLIWILETLGDFRLQRLLLTVYHKCSLHSSSKHERHNAWMNQKSADSACLFPLH